MATQLGVKIRSSYLGQEGIVGRFPPGTSIVEECRDSIYAVRLTELQLTGEVVNPRARPCGVASMDSLSYFTTGYGPRQTLKFDSSLL